RFFAPDFSSAHVTLFCRDHEVGNVRRMIARAQAFIAGHALERAHFRMAGGLVGVLAAVYEEVLRNNILMNVLSFGTIFLICVITYPSFFAGVLLMVSMLVDTSVMTTYLGECGICNTWYYV